MREVLTGFGVAGILIGLALLFGQPPAYQWDLPEGVPLPSVPADNPMSNVKVALGRQLFYDQRLSVNRTMSCGTCHMQRFAFTDAKTVAIGATGERHPRGSMSLVNAAYSSRLTWANHLLDKLESQALTPLFGEDPIEMGMSGREDDIIATLRSDGFYTTAFPTHSLQTRIPIPS